MRYRPLGNTGHHVSEVGLGTYPLGGTLITSGSYWSGPATYGEVLLETAVETIHHGLSLGLNFIDTAPVYSEAEVYIAEALRRRPQHLQDMEVFVETKGGEHVRPVADGGPPVLARDFSAARPCAPVSTAARSACRQTLSKVCSCTARSPRKWQKTRWACSSSYVQRGT